jgi:lipocalin
LCLAERDASKLWLLSEKTRTAEEKKKRHSAASRKRSFITEALINSRPGSPAKNAKKRRSSRLRC